MNNNIDNNNPNSVNVPVTPTVPTTPTVQPTTQDKFVMQQPQIVNSNTVQMPQVTQPQQPVSNVPTGQDPNRITNENLKTVEIKNYTPPNKFKIVLLILFFIILIAFVLFLPEITEFIKKYTSGQDKYEKEVIKTGNLVCSQEKSTTDLDKEYELTFTFIDSELTKTKFVTTTRGDSTVDTEVLDSLANSCKKLDTETKDLEGIVVRCDYTDSMLIETQSIDLEVVDQEKLDAAFTEAGGILPGYQYKENIDGIERNMKVSGYTCKREK